MGKRLKFLLIVVGAVLLSAGSAMAVPFTFGDGGTALQGVLDDITVDPSGDSSIDVTQDAMLDNSDSYWNITGTGGSVATVIIELASFADNNIFGVYDQSDPTNRVQLFAGSATLGAQVTLSIKADGSVFLYNTIDTGVDFSSYTFGYYLETPDQLISGTTTPYVFYSDTNLNADGIDHMAAYQGLGTDTVQLPSWGSGTWSTNEYVLAFEDLLNGGDKDYTDFVAMVESVESVPEPGSLAALGFGVMGLLGLARRRFS